MTIAALERAQVLAADLNRLDGSEFKARAAATAYCVNSHSPDTLIVYDGETKVHEYGGVKTSPFPLPANETVLAGESGNDQYCTMRILEQRAEKRPKNDETITNAQNARCAHGRH